MKSRYEPGETRITRPDNSLPLSWSMALRASSAVAISTNPIAFDARVVPSVTTSQVTTRPAPSNSLCNSASVVLTGRRWTCSIVGIFVLFHLVENGELGDSSQWGVHPTLYHPKPRDSRNMAPASDRGRGHESNSAGKRRQRERSQGTNPDRNVWATGRRHADG